MRLNDFFSRWKPPKEEVIQRSEPQPQPQQQPQPEPAKIIPVYVAGKPGSEVYTESLAMKVSAYLRAVSILSGTVGSLPLLFEKKDHGVFRPSDGNLQYLLTKKPNDDFTSFQFMREIVKRTMSDGNAYIYPRYYKGECYELTLLSKDSCSYDKQRHVYRISDSVNGVSGVYQPWQVIHIRNIGLDGGYTGLSTIQYASRCLGIAQSADEQSLDTFDDGAMIKGMVAGDSKVTGWGGATEQQRMTVADRIESELASGKNIIGLPEGFKFQSLQMTVAEAKLLEHREFNVFEIARFTGVPPEKLFVNMSQNYKASESSQINFLNDSITPIITQIEQEFTTKLIPKALSYTQRIRFDRVALLNTDITSQADYFSKMHGMGALTTNEIRARQGLLPVPGGDEPLISTNLQKLNNINNGTE